MLSGLVELFLATSEHTKLDIELDPKTLSGGVTLFTAIMAVAVLVGVATKILQIPYTVALVLAGLFVAILQQAPAGSELHPDLVFYIILPPILFRAGLQIDVKSLGKYWKTVASVTTLSVISTTLVVGFAIHGFLTPDLINSQLAWVAAFMVGAMVSPTDPVSVLPIIRMVRLPKSIRTVIEGESLFNDGIAVVLFFILFSAIFIPAYPMHGGGDGPGQSQPVITADTADELTSSKPQTSLRSKPKEAVPSIWAGILKFLGNTGIGLLVGAALAFGAIFLMRWAQDPALENTITVVLAYGSFIISAHQHVSGVAAVIVAGILVGVLRWRDNNDMESEKTIETFWESIDYIMNSLIFLVVGFELQFIGVDRLLDPKVLTTIGVVYLAMLVARAIVVYPFGWLAKPWPRGGSNIVCWAGLRGCVTLALVLVLPDSILTVPDALKEFLLPVIFGVVLLTLILQATTMRMVIHLVGLEEDHTSNA